MKLQQKTLLKVSNLKLYYPSEYGPVWAANSVSLEVKEREVVGIVGESGCGKSTLALTLIGLNSTAKIVDGEIIFKGCNLLKLPPKEMQKIRGRDMTLIFQNPTTYLNPVMKIKRQLMEILLRHYPSLTQEEAMSKITQTLSKVGLHSRVLENYPFEMSGGMLQRVMIVMMLLSGPSLLIADEPTSALDVTIQTQVLNLLKSLQKSEGISIVVITHDLGIVADICDRVYVMYAGKVVESADVYTLYEKPMHPYTAGLLNSILSIDEYKEFLPTLLGEVPDLARLPPGCAFHPRCSRSKNICQKEEPPSIEVGQEHMVACWLYAGRE
jgi:oligopeptide/dipeptide ABC transporter ATP-binding protein